MTEDAGSSQTKASALSEFDGLWIFELLHFTEKKRAPGRENHWRILYYLCSDTSWILAR